MSEKFVPLTREQLATRYGSFYVRRVPLDEQVVPEPLRALTPYAELWGIGDDVDRDHLVREAPPIARADLAALLQTYWREFNPWLGGPEADGPKFSKEYLAFSNLRIAADSAEGFDDDAAVDDTPDSGDPS